MHEMKTMNNNCVYYLMTVQWFAQQHVAEIFVTVLCNFRLLFSVAMVFK